MLMPLTILGAVFLTSSCAQEIPFRAGSQSGKHGCVADGGYEWCESTQSCVRLWETPCPVGPEPTVIGCPTTCPPPAPCPMLGRIPNHCVVVPAGTDKCGCTISCPSIDCSHIPIPLGQEGDPCQGYMPHNVAARCDIGLECVYTSGNAVDVTSDPGTCMLTCPTSRDAYGNCIDTPIPRIPRNCVTWYDGCNTCSAVKGELHGCTMMMCFTQSEPYCQAFQAGALRVNDICYRFCEDGSQNSIDRRKDCPAGTQCGPPDASVISYDSCGLRAHTCKGTRNI